MNPRKKFFVGGFLVWLLLPATSTSLHAACDFAFPCTMGGTTPDYGLSVYQGGSGGAIMGVAEIKQYSAAAGVYGYGDYATGVMGFSTENAAVYGTSMKSYGVQGVTSAETSAGVLGQTYFGGTGVIGYSEKGLGVWGKSEKDDTAGVLGENDNNQAGFGVVGYAQNGVGVVGEGGTHGVSGLSHSPDRAGGYFKNDAQGFGIYTTTDTPVAANRATIASLNVGSGYGLQAQSKQGTGISGKGLKRGVWGDATATDTKGTGVYGSAAGSSGVGVQGSSKKGKGIQGTTDTGTAVSGLAYKDKGWAGQFVGYSAASGVLIVTHGGPGLVVKGGSKSAVVSTSEGPRLLYAEEATEVYFTDYGSGRLQDGKAVIPVDPLFAETVTLGQPYHVFVQSYSDAQLVVSRRSSREFEVRLNVRDTEGDRNAEFSYRLVAKRKGFEQTRLERPPFLDNAEKIVDATTPRVAEEPPLLSVSEISGVPDPAKPRGLHLPVRENALSYRSMGDRREIRDSASGPTTQGLVDAKCDRQYGSTTSVNRTPVP